MSTSTTCKLFLERDDPTPELVESPLGEIVVYSARAPGKSLNEDGAGLIWRDTEGVLAVADGMGGMASADQASRAALESLAERVSESDDPNAPLRHAVLEGFERANAAVLALGVGAGTTLTALVLRDGSGQSMHAGDSIMLHVGQRGRVKALTMSHSPTGYAIEAGWLDEDDAMHHAERHIIANFVGFEAMRIELGAAVPIAPRDTLLVASDGLADNLRLEEIIEIVRKGPLLEAGRRLAELGRTRMESPQPDAPCKPDDLTFVLFRPAQGAGG